MTPEQEAEEWAEDALRRRPLLTAGEASAEELRKYVRQAVALNRISRTTRGNAMNPLQPTNNENDRQEF